VPAFQKRGYELLLIHIGSWGHDKDRPSEERIDDLVVRDISYYRGFTFRDILLKEAPDAILFLSTRAFIHQAINMYANSLGITTCHLYHGLVNVQAVDYSDKTYETNWASQFTIIKERIVKNIFLILPKYIKALVNNHASPSEWIYFFKELSGKTIAQLPKVAPPDAKTTIGCVYTQADVAHMIRTYRVPDDRVYVVGNPDLLTFNFSRDKLGCCLKDNITKTKDIMYIDTALIEAGVVFDGKKDFINHLITTYEELKKNGFNLVLKLHPGHFRSGITLKLQKIGMDICEKEEFVPRLEKSFAAIVEPSTAAMIPALMGLPILLAIYGKLRNQAFGKVLTSYPRARYINEIKELHRLISEEVSGVEYQAVWKWINENSGPLPAEDMPERVVEAVLNASAKFKTA